MPGMASPGLEDRIDEPIVTGLPVPGHLGSAIGRPMPGISWHLTSDCVYCWAEIRGELF